MINPACQKSPVFPKLYHVDEVRGSASRMDEIMDAKLTFEDLDVGQEWTSPSRTITETDVVNFATITGDMNPLHINHEFAKNTPYRQPVAHGLLGLSWVAGLGSNSPQVDTVAFACIRSWEFNRPLFFGDTVHVETEVISKQDNAKRSGRVAWRLRLINQRGEVTQQGEFETLVRVAKPLRGPHFQSDEEAAETKRVSENQSDAS